MLMLQVLQCWSLLQIKRVSFPASFTLLLMLYARSSPVDASKQQPDPSSSSSPTFNPDKPPKRSRVAYSEEESCVYIIILLHCSIYIPLDLLLRSKPMHHPIQIFHPQNRNEQHLQDQGKRKQSSNIMPGLLFLSLFPFFRCIFVFYYIFTLSSLSLCAVYGMCAAMFFICSVMT